MPQNCLEGLSALRFWRVIWSWTLVCASTCLAMADVVHTKDGRRLEGRIVSETTTAIEIETRLGRVKVLRSEVQDIERGQSPREEFRTRFEAAKSDVPALVALAAWTDEQSLPSERKKCFRRIVELEPDHEVANLGLGNVRYRGEWLSPRERGARQKADEKREREAQGLVEHEGRWVTPEDRERMVAGLILFEGEWLTVAAAMARQGLGLVDEAWIPLPLAEAVARTRALCAAVGSPGVGTAGVGTAGVGIASVGIASVEAALGDTVIAGPWPKAFLEDIAKNLVRARARFDIQFKDVPPGVALFGGKAAELYVWSRDSRPYIASIEPLSALTTTVGAPWREAVENTHGWVFWDPYPISSVRAIARPDLHLAGHCYYHYGHILLNRHRYDGRLLPPWFGEGYAGLVEWWCHGHNTVVLKADASALTEGTAARGKEPPFGREALTRGDWQLELHRALTEKDPRLEPFDLVARKAAGQLTTVDVAMAMGIVAWLDDVGDGALDRFHAELKRSAPKAPEQTLAETAPRVARYDSAFRAAVQLDTRAADRAWRAWFLGQKPIAGTDAVPADPEPKKLEVEHSLERNDEHERAAARRAGSETSPRHATLATGGP